ncbi:hypothetical protein LIER_10270 [Lithospermum erythrorhizon]|uniref:Uncharacterized protein n=1 Tax=Lithospermum erythrorhizon TaxID=34254 RepID=A0AAV3PJX8_LITER
MAGIIHEITGTIADSVMQQLRERIPHLRRESPMEPLSIHEEEEETYTYTPPVRGNHEPATGRQNHHEVAAGCAVAPTPQPHAMAAL